MLMDILRRFNAPEPDPLTPADSRLALSALLVRLARRDEDYTETERRMIDRVLEDRYGLSGEGARALRAEAETLESEAPDTVRFTRMIKGAVPFEERVGVIEALWRVALADGITAEEHGFIRLVANLVGVPDVESGLARQRVQREDG